MVVRWEISGRTIDSRTSSKQHAESLSSFHIAFSEGVSLKSKFGQPYCCTDTVIA